METTEITIKVPRSWAIKLASLANEGDYPSLNAMLLEALDMEFYLPREEWMGERMDSWWDMV